ncbi:TauD/TfdA dioxygenase family protein [Sphingomonas montanisoli]|nr:TauD/TfdA family dioxygenase [Sphingomonas montanisoli]
MKSLSASRDASAWEIPMLPGAAERLSAETGVRLSGMDLLDLDDTQYRQLAMLISSACVVVISDNPLTPPQQVEFARRLGDILIVPGVKRHVEQPELFVVENPAGSSAGADFFHSDASFLPRPPSYSILAGMEVPAFGGNTMFSNQYAAWATLSPALQDYLRDATARHGSARLTDPSQLTEGVPHHPLRRVHPLTKRTALYLTSLDRVQNIDGVPAQESAAILKFLYDHSCRPENVYRHRWMQDDVVIWDNRCTMHSAVGDAVSSDRVLHRVVCAGEVPAH